MQVMIVEEDPTLRTQITGALAPEGVDILSFGRIGPAKDAVRRANVDILVLGESVGGRLASDLALLAEWRNPRLGAILLSDREGAAAEELYDLIPSLQAVLGRRTGPRTLARVAIATARSQEAIVVVQEEPWTPQDLDEPSGPEAWDRAGLLDAGDVEGVPARSVAPLQQAPLPIAERPVATAPAPALTSPPVAAAPNSPQVPALLEKETFASLRERLIHAQERLAALEVRAPAAELPTPRHEAPEASPGLLYVLPSFLRDAEDEGETEPQDHAPPTTPHPAYLPAQAAPRRRLNLA